MNYERAVNIIKENEKEISRLRKLNLELSEKVAELTAKLNIKEEKIEDLREDLLDAVD